jgi:hypothetical protein
VPGSGSRSAVSWQLAVSIAELPVLRPVHFADADSDARQQSDAGVNVHTDDWAAVYRYRDCGESLAGVN